MASWRSARAGGVLITLLVLAGCGDSLFASLDNRGEVELLIHASDANAVVPGETIPLQLQYRDEFADALTAIEVTMTPVRDRSDIVHQVEIIPNGGTGESTFVVDVPAELLPGVYTIAAVGWQGSTEVVSREWQAFVTPASLRVQQLSLVPIRPVVNSQSLALAVLEVPEGQRPWLQWRVGDEYVRSGYLEDGLGEVTLDLGPERGAYPVRLEVFPWGPEEGVQFTRSTVAPVTATAEVIVRGQSDPSAVAAPGESLLWYPLTGYLRATVVRDPLLTEKDLFAQGAPDAVIPSGAALQYRGGVLGYLIPSGEQLVVPMPLIISERYETRIEATLVFPEASDAPLYLAVEQENSTVHLALLSTGELVLRDELPEEDDVVTGETAEETDSDAEEIGADVLLVPGTALQLELFFARSANQDRVILSYALRSGTNTEFDGSLPLALPLYLGTTFHVGGTGSRGGMVSSVAVSWPSVASIEDEVINGREVETDAEATADPEATTDPDAKAVSDDVADADADADNADTEATSDAEAQDDPPPPTGAPTPVADGS